MSGIIDCEMHIGDEVFVHGYIDEIRNDTIIIRNVGGYFGTSRDEVFYYEEDERGYGTMNEADRKTEPSNSEKPNNCECEPRKEQNFCGKCRYLYRDFKYGLSCYRLMDNEPCKYEERKDEPQTDCAWGRTE